MDNIVLTVIIAAIPSVISGAVLIAINTGNKKSDAREDARKKESILILKNIDAIGTLSEQTARCFRGEKPNGELTAALEYRKKLKHELEDHLMLVNAEVNH